MKRLSICVDIDGTITEPLYWLESVNHFFNTSIKLEEITSYDVFYTNYNISYDELLEYYKLNGAEIHANANIRENASYYLQELYRIHDLYYVTARMSYMDDVTKTWLEKYGIPYKEIHLLGSHDKLDKAKELNCDIFIEDRYENAIQLSEAGIDVILIDCVYNQDELNDKITRAHNWSDIFNTIKRMESGD